MKPLNLPISLENQGQRLDKFLTGKLTDLSRSQIQKAVKNGGVLVNNKTVSVHHFLKENDIVTINSSTPRQPLSTTKKITAIEKNNNYDGGLFSQIKIIAEENNFLIIEKPAGLLVHPTEKNENDTLVDWLIKKYPALKKIGENPARPALVHRLDKDVSGLMLVPKNQDSFDYFKRQFKLHEITKKYLALAYGDIPKDEDEINFPIGRSQNKSGLFVARPLGNQLSDESKVALTLFKVIKRYRKYTLLEVDIKTGRTHQIRVHLLAYGHPLVGDPLYQLKKNKKTDLTRPFLHAYYLSFKDATGKPWEFKIDLPDNLEKFLSQLKTH